MFYVFNDDRTSITEVNEEFDNTKVQMYSDKVIALENTILINGDLYDKSEPEFLDFVKINKQKEIEAIFKKCLEKGSEYCYVTTSIIGNDNNNIVMDCSEVDLTNIEGLLKLMIRYDQTTTTITDYFNNYHGGITIEQVEEITYEMLLRGAELHTKKGTIRYQISEAKTIEEVEQIHWFYEAKRK